jgi:hypothetical protein
MTWIDARDELRLLTDVEARQKRVTKPSDKMVSDNLSIIYREYPFLPAGVALSLAESNADSGTIALAAQQAGKTAAAKYAAEAQQRAKAAEQKNQSGWKTFGSNIWNGVKWVGSNTVGRIPGVKETSRLVSAASTTGAEVVQNTASLFAPNNEDGVELVSSFTQGTFGAAAKDFVASTSLGALAGGDDVGSGYFLGGEAEESRAAAARRFRGTVNGSTWTVGRGAADGVFTAGSLPYTFLSGTLDAAIAWKADPINFIGKKAKAAREARLAISGLETADEISAARKLANGAAGLLSTAEEHAIDNSKFFNWLDNSGSGRRLVNRVVGETDELEIMEGFNWKITPEQARRLAQADDVDSVRGIIAEQAIRLSDETVTGVVPFATNATQIPLTLQRTRIPGNKVLRNSRWLSGAPKELMLVNGTPQDKTDALKNITNWLRTMNIDTSTGEGADLMRKAFDAYGADGTKVDVDQLFRMFMGDVETGASGIVSLALKKAGWADDAVETIVSTYQRNINAMRQFALDATGEVNDGGFVKYLLSSMTPDEVYDIKKYFTKTRILPGMTPTEIDDIINNLDESEIVLHGPAALVDLLNNVQVLPDPKQMRRMTTMYSPINNPFFRLGSKKVVTAPLATVEWMQNNLWRPYALTTFGFIMRNQFDAQLRLAATGFSTSRPLDWILLVMNKAGKTSLNKGQKWVREGEEVAFNMDDVVEYEAFTRGSTHLWVGDPQTHLNRLVKNNDIAIVNTGSSNYGRGLTESMRRVFADPILRMVARLQHLPEPRQVDLMVEFLDNGSKEANLIKRTLVRYAKDGFKVANPKNGKRYLILKYPNWETMSTREVVEAWYENLGKPQVEQLILNGNEQMRVMAGYGHVPVSASEMWDETDVLSYTGGKRPKVGEVFTEDVTIDLNNPKFNHFLVLEREAPAVAGGARQYKIVQVTDIDQAFMGDTGSNSLMNVVDDLVQQHDASLARGDGPVVPYKVRLSSMVKPEDVRDPSAKAWDAARYALDFVPQWFFNNLVPYATTLLERSPAFRMSYYQNAAENSNLLSPSEAQKFLDSIAELAEIHYNDVWVKSKETAMHRVVGGKPIYNQLVENAKKAKAGTSNGTVEQLHTYSATLAAEDMKNLLFDAASRSNLEDAFRIASPFGYAWREVITKWGKILMEDPSRVTNAQKIFRGLEDFDPDADGRGFIWKDPQTGERMFTFPGSGPIITALTTLSSSAGYGAAIPMGGASLSAPVKRMSAGLTVWPSVGPAGQVAASWLFNRIDSPKLNGLRKIVTPYGDTKLTGLVPGWISKAYSAFEADPSKLDTIYGNTFSDVAAYLATTGEYDLADSNSVTKMMEDARQTGALLTYVRAFSQFMGPTSGRVDYRIDTNYGDVYVNELIKAFHELEDDNYETAIPIFLETFGDQALIYVGSKTRVNEKFGGLEATKEFGEWEQANNDLITSFKTTAAYLAPGGSDFSFEVWSSQVGTGKRIRQDPEERVAQAQKRVGSYLYSVERAKFGINPSKNERAELRNIRKDIHKRYPGFPIVSEFKTGEFDNFIDSLKRLVKDDRTKGNKTAETISKYLKKRDEVNAELAKSGRTLKSTRQIAMEAKNELYAYGELLIDENPEFARIWQRELSAEVESGSLEE